VQSASALILILLGVVWLAPNTQELTAYLSADGQTSAPRPVTVPKWAGAKAAALGVVFAFSFLSLSRVTEFIYFQF
jgi:hypothetical protein